MRLTAYEELALFNKELERQINRMENEISDYRNTLLNCLTQFEFYVDATDFKDSGNAAIKHIQKLLKKYESDAD